MFVKSIVQTMSEIIQVDRATSNISLRNYFQDWDICLLCQEDSTVAEASDSSQSSPGGRAPIKGGPTLVLSSIGFMDLVVKPHVGHSHPVLGQGASLVGADGGGGTKGLHSFKVLYQAVLLGHTLGSQSQTHL